MCRRCIPTRIFPTKLLNSLGEATFIALIGVALRAARNPNHCWLRFLTEAEIYPGLGVVDVA